MQDAAEVVRSDSVGRWFSSSLLLMWLLAFGGKPLHAASLSSTWLGGSGSWSDPARWSDGVPQNTASDSFQAAVDGGNPLASAVGIDGGVVVDSLTIDPGDRVTIAASGSLSAQLVEGGGEIDNLGMLGASGGHTLGTGQLVVQNAGGVIQLDGGHWSSSDQTNVIGGDFVAENGSTAIVSATFSGTRLSADATSSVTLGGGLSDVTFATGHFTLSGRVSGALVNSAVLEGALILDGPATIENHGQIIVTYDESSSLTLSGGGAVTYQTGSDVPSPTTFTNLDNQIRGSGRIRLASNAGPIDATGGLLDVFGNPTVQHDGIFGAAPGGTLQVRDVTGGGSWSAHGGTIHALGNVATSGDISVTDGGSLIVDTSMTGRNLTIDSTGTLDIEGALRLAGNVDLDGSAGGRFVFGPGASFEAAHGGGAAVGDWANWQFVEVAGRDLGDDPTAFRTTNAYLPELVIGPDGRLFFEDHADNGNRQPGVAEAIYVDTLVFDDAQGLLDLNGIRLFYNHLVGSASQIIDVAVPEPSALVLATLALTSLGVRRRSSTAAQ